MSDPLPPIPQQTAVQRLQHAVSRRSDTDYMFDFWTALGWTILTCGLYTLYVVYRLFWRSVEHNRRRIEVLEAARLLSWERAVATGRDTELTTRFQALGAHLAEMHRLAGEFREPVVWMLIAAFTNGIGTVVGAIFLDMDLVRHEGAEVAAERELAAIGDALGVALGLPPDHPPKQRHNYVGRLLAVFATCGLYGLWWGYDLMVEGNEHQRRSWVSDDALWTASAALVQR